MTLEQIFSLSEDYIKALLEINEDLSKDEDYSQGYVNNYFINRYRAAKILYKIGKIGRDKSYVIHSDLLRLLLLKRTELIEEAESFNIEIKNKNRLELVKNLIDLEANPLSIVLRTIKFKINKNNIKLLADIIRTGIGFPTIKEENYVLAYNIALQYDDKKILDTLYDKFGKYYDKYCVLNIFKYDIFVGDYPSGDIEFVSLERKHIFRKDTYEIDLRNYFDTIFNTDNMTRPELEILKKLDNSFLNSMIIDHRSGEFNYVKIVDVLNRKSVTVADYITLRKDKIYKLYINAI